MSVYGHPSNRQTSGSAHHSAMRQRSCSLMIEPIGLPDPAQLEHLPGRSERVPDTPRRTTVGPGEQADVPDRLALAHPPFAVDVQVHLDLCHQSNPLNVVRCSMVSMMASRVYLTMLRSAV